jgi:hypothetical protein
MSAVEVGDNVYSDFNVVNGFAIEPSLFAESHIGIAAQFDHDDITGKPSHCKILASPGSS